jgi:flagellar motor protein MotB
MPGQAGARRYSGLARAAILAGALLPGCASSSMVMKGQIDRYEQQLAVSRDQYQQLQERANALDRQHQDAVAALGQARQQAAVYEDQVAAMREQLRGTTAQLAQVKAEKDDSQKKVEALTASLRRTGGVSITPNNSLLQTLPNLNLPPGYVRRDGEVIRVALPGNQLFDSGGATLRPDGIGLILAAAGEIARLYPDQMIGVEGYTDTDPIHAGRYRNNHELSVARAMAVYDVLVARTRLQPAQLFVVGHGPNHPMMSNATPQGKEANRRVELVVYPERKP